jgi:ATP-dependent Clp protease ATP-binding subunit ClpB
MLPDDVIAMAELAFKMPIASATQAESQKLLGLADEIHQYMIDQEEAVKQIANALQRSRAGLKDSKKPIGSFLFVGPTGVGKTELAKTLAKVYFKGESTMIRLDMSEFQNADSITRLIGGPNQNSSFIDKVKNQPFSLILLDEIEKASGSILDLFLQVLDDGRLTDSQGETISFRETIIIATSNIGAKAIGEAIAANKNYPELKKITIDELKNNLRLEFINRFDDIIVFKPLGREEILAITKLMINQVNQTLVSKKISLNLTDAAYAKLAEIGFDPVFGARPLRRTIQDKIEAPLAKALLSGQIKQGNIVTIDAEQI